MRFSLSLFLVLISLLAVCGPKANSEPAAKLRSSDLEESLLREGFDNSEDVQSFIASMQTNLKNDDRIALVKMIRLPLKLYSGPKKTYTDENAVIRDFDKIFSSTVLSAIENARYQDLFVNSQGAMLGDGAIWFDKRDGKIQIKAINP